MPKYDKYDRIIMKLLPEIDGSIGWKLGIVDIGPYELMKEKHVGCIPMFVFTSSYGHFSNCYVMYYEDAEDGLSKLWLAFCEEVDNNQCFYYDLDYVNKMMNKIIGIDK